MSSNDSEIARRIERLERDNRRLKLAVGFAALVGGAFLTMGQVSPRPYDQDVLRVKGLVAEKVAILNNKGQPVAGLEGTSDGTPLLFMNAGDDKHGFFVAAKDGLMSLNVVDPKSKSQLALKHDGLFMRDDGGKDKVILTVRKSQSDLIFHDEANARRLVLGVSEGSKSFLDLFDPSGRLRWSFSGTDTRSR